ncbi:MAG TPA: phosphatidylglycerophosphatase A [Polyangiaceae bacterium]|nr:phosphatidylglycerophosphatase A [Polyangiaceae bacterium]
MLPAPRSARYLATWFGCGNSPLAPGTAGSIATLPLHWLLRASGPFPQVAVCVALTGAGVWAADRVVRAGTDQDPSHVVIDEVVGTLISLGLAPRGWAPQLAALVLFRVLDIVKPGLIDRSQTLKPAGLGIMADDVLAGLGAGFLVKAACKILR